MQKNNILNKVFFVIGFAALVVLNGCGEPGVESKQIKQIDFVDELNELSKNPLQVSDLKMVKSKHGRFFDVWFSEIMDYSKYSRYPDSMIANMFNYWLQVNRPVFAAVQKHYSVNTDWKNSLDYQWSKLQSELSNVPDPVLYGYFSQFSNYNTFVDTFKGKTLLGYSKEMFMNDTFALYKALDVPSFYMRYNDPNQIPTLLIWNYLKSRFEAEHKINNMLSQAVFEGKIWALLMHISDRDAPNLDLGYTADEWAMMERDQGQMWRLILDQKALYSTDFNLYRRYFVYGDQTFGAGIPQGCPPLIGNFVGYKIVSKYIDETGCSWDELFKTTDATKILRLSGYNPIK